jgi:TolA-binding protein
MGFAHRAFVAAGVGFAMSAIVGCGSSGSLLSQSEANQLTAQLNSVSSALYEGRCSEAEDALTSFQEKLAKLNGVDSTLVSNLNQGASTIEQLTSTHCDSDTQTQTRTRADTTPTHTATTHTTTTVTTDTDTVPTTTVTTSTYPTTTYTPPPTSTTGGYSPTGTTTATTPPPPSSGGQGLGGTVTTTTTPSTSSTTGYPPTDSYPGTSTTSYGTNSGNPGDGQGF